MTKKSNAPVTLKLFHVGLWLAVLAAAAYLIVPSVLRPHDPAIEGAKVSSPPEMNAN